MDEGASGDVQVPQIGHVGLGLKFGEVWMPAEQAGGPPVCVTVIRALADDQGVVQLLQLFHGAVGDRLPAEFAAGALALLSLSAVLDAAVAEVAVGGGGVGRPAAVLGDDGCGDGKFVQGPVPAV